MPRRRKTDPIEVCTGSKKRTSKKTAASRVKSGLPQAAILVTGATTAKRDSAFNSTKMEISTKACGPWTRSTDKEPTGDLMLANFAENTQATGLKIRSTAEAPSSSKTATGTMDTG